MADHAPPPRPPPPPLQQQSPLTYPYSLNFQSSTSVAIIIVVLGATFFFMFLFVIYVKRCNTEQFNHGDRIASAAGMSGSDGSSNNAGTWNQHHSHIHGLDPAVLQKFPVLRFSSAVALDRSGSNGGSGGGGGGAKNKRSNTAKKGSGSTGHGTAAKIVDGPIECAVCLGAFEEGEFLRILPACGHLFHPDCIDAWLGTHSTCPLCRRSLSRDAMSGHLLQKALAAIASLRGLANFGSSNETGSSSPESSLSHASPPPPVPHEVASRPRLVQPDLEILLDLESQQEQEQRQEGSEQGQIIRTLSRNSESFKAAAQSVEIQDRSSSSSRYYNSLSNPSSSAMLGFVSPGRLRSLAPPAAMSPIACGRIHHSHSLTNLLAGNSSPLNPCSLCGQPDQQLRLWRSVSASGQRINPGRES